MARASNADKATPDERADASTAQREPGLHAQVAQAALAAQRVGDYSSHAQLHSLETVLGEAKVKAAAILAQAGQSDLALIAMIVDTL